MITICIATYNGIEFIRQTIKSVLEQDYSDFEIIIVDDCSSDETVNIIHNDFESDSRINVISNSSNMGFCKSVNKGLALAKGEYFLVLGQDDLLEKNHISSILKCFSSDVAVVFCDYDLIDENGVVYDRNDHCQHRDMIPKDFLKCNVIPSCGLIMRTEIIRMAGGYPELRAFPHYGEYHTWIRMAELGKVKYCSAVRAQYRRHKNNMTNDFGQRDVKIKLEEYYNICRKQLLHSKNISLFDKAKIVVYMFYRSIKVRL